MQQGNRVKEVGICAVVTAICTTSVAVWMAVPALSYILSRQDLEADQCGLRKYQGYFCKDEMQNGTLCITSQYQYTMELEMGAVLSAAYRNGTHCYQIVKSHACKFYFESFQPAAAVCKNWCESENFTSVSQIFSQKSWKCDGGSDNTDPMEKNCSTLFYYNATLGLCQPTCDVDNGSGGGFLYVFAPIGMLGCVIAFIIACINWKIIFRFPSVLLMYWLGAALAYDCGLLIQCCKRDDFLETPGIFYPLCILKDLIMYFGGCLLIFFSLFHTTILFWSVWFPIYSKRILDEYRHRIHAGVVLLCIAMPWIGVASIVGFNSADAVFYASLPLYGSGGLISAFVGLIVWKLMRRNKQKDQVCLWLKCHSSCTPEVKLTIVFIFVVLLFAATMARNILDINKTHEYFYDYLLCESTGSQPCTLHVNSYASAVQYFDILHNAVFSLSSYFSLIYIVPIHNIKKVPWRRDSQQTMQRNNTTLSNNMGDAEMKD